MVRTLLRGRTVFRDGRVVRTILRGTTVFHDGRIVADEPLGRLLTPTKGDPK